MSIQSQTRPARQPVTGPAPVATPAAPHPRGVTALAVAATTVVGIGLTVLVAGVNDGREIQAPPSPGVVPAAEAVAPVHGSDQRLYNRAADLYAQRQHESAHGSDRRLHLLAEHLRADR